MAKLLLIDGHSQAYRAFFGMKTPLSTRTGELTGAVYGFARKLLSIIKEYQPDEVAVAFDLGDTWRHSTFIDYKATRDAMPDEMRTQMTRIEELVRAFNIPIITYPDYEADDVLGTISRQAAEAGTDVLILTGDRDLFQLISERVQILYTPGGPNPKTTVYGPPELQERYELTPDQFIDLKALTGDSSDNIPGVPGVGEKTAVKFLKEYETLDNLYAHIDEISGPKTRQNLIDAQPQVELNKKLVTIVRDLDVTYDPQRCHLQDYDQEAVIKLFNELEFRSLLKELPQTALPTSNDKGQMGLFDAPVEEPATAEASAGNRYRCVQDQAALENVVAQLKRAKILSFDVETTGTDAIQAALVGLGVAWAPGEAAYIPVAHQDGDQLPWEVVRAAVAPFFADPQLPKVAHNGKYDLTICLRNGLAINGPIHDTMTMAWLLDPASRALGLKDQAALELEWEMTEITELIGKGRKQVTIDQVEIAATGAYCGADVDATIQLFNILAPRLREAGMWDLYAEIELPLLPVLTDMELAGVKLDLDYLADMSTRLTDRLQELETDLFAIVGHEFNLRSTQQLSQVLFDEMNFPTKGLSKTKGGQISTAVSELEKLANMTSQLSAEQQRVITILFEQRQLEKLRGTYVDALPALVNPDTSRVHTSFNQTGAVTGRMSSSNPNLQNIPIRTDLGREIRRAFVAPEGWSLVAADYSQVELRILAHVAKEEILIDAFRNDQDIHATTASKLFHVTIDEVTREQRGLAKTINFATIYGSSAFGISNRTDMDPKEAQHFLDQYFVTYPRIKEYIDQTTQKLLAEGYVETLMGRKRFFPELQNNRLPYNQRMAIERAAINAPIQGTAADIMKVAMIRLHAALVKGNYRARMLLQVHDELVLEVPEEECDAVTKLICDVMENAYQLDVPLRVDVEAGPNWYDLEEVVVKRDA
ncbi:MAG TPA: DNA polymerase I [Caldilineaceae bacterium]|nr:DNA polymerase I [Caldilineaceae bacterium]